MDAEWEPGVVYMRHMTDGKGSIEVHECWHRSKFVTSEFAACEASNAKKKDDEPTVSIEVASAEEYAAQRAAQRRAG